MLYKIIVRDITRFTIIYSIFLIGFSQSFYILFLGYRRNDTLYINNSTINKREYNIMSNVLESFIRMFIMSLTEFAVLFEQLEQCELKTIGKITFIVYMLLVTMLLMNLLIAMMTDTYQRVSENHLEYLRQWSAIVLNMEQSFDSETRLQFQRRYSVPLDRKGIGLLMKIRITVSN